MTSTGVFITALSLSQFRSYGTAKLKIEEPRPFVALTGENGAGKTNLLEALSLFAPGRGLRRASMDELHRRGAPAPWAVAAEFQVGTDRSAETLRAGTGQDPTAASNALSGTGIHANTGQKRRLIRLDGSTHASSEIFARHWNIVWITPQMDRLFLDAPSGRRQFLDRLVLGLYSDHARQVNRFEKAMRERNRLLQTPNQLDTRWCASLEREMAASASAIASARADYASQLAGQLEQHIEQDFPPITMALEGDSETAALSGHKPTEIEEDLMQLWEETRAMDRKAGRTLKGPHKTDLLVFHADKNMPADQCSTGEQKALLLSLMIANVRLISLMTGRVPLLLMDEVAAHLDERRRSALFRALEALGGQVWFTGTDAESFSELGDKCHAFHVNSPKDSGPLDVSPFSKVKDIPLPPSQPRTNINE